MVDECASGTHKRISEQLVFDFVSSHIQKPAPIVPRLDHSFPEDFANQLAAAEAYNKHLYRPNTYLHKWWARRCGTTFRMILKQLVADEARQDFYSPGGLEGRIVLDPMMGGGTTLHEAIRLGANVIGVDIDPIPVLQARATLTHTPLPRLKSAFEQFFSILHRHVAPWFETRCPDCESPAEIKFTLYGLRRSCSCGQVLFVDSYVLREEQERTIRICPTCHCVHTGEHACHTCATPLVEKGTRRCPTCGEGYTDLTDVRFVDRYIPLVIVGECARHGQFFKPLDDADRARWQEARERIYWVFQEYVYRNLSQRYNLDLTYDQSEATVFALYDLKPQVGRLTLAHSRSLSATIDELFYALRYSSNILKKDTFVKVLKKRIDKQTPALQLHF